MDSFRKTQSWSLIIFFYNEEGNIEKVCRQAIDFLSILSDDNKEIIFVNDGSTDQSVKKARQITQGKSFVKFINHEKNLSIGASLKRGYESAKMENVCAVPGDGQFNVNELRAFRTIPSKTVISFFRISHKRYSFLRKGLTQINRGLNRILFGVNVRDVNWVKIYKTSSINGLNLQSKSSYIESEIMYRLKRKGFKVIQSPSCYQSRFLGQSKSVTISSLKGVGRDIFNLFISKFLT